MSTFRAYLQLVRLPAVFTAMADILLGFLLTHHSLAPTAERPSSLIQFALLLTASCCLYLAGMVFNDVFDRKVDAVERPGRPLPSGRISLQAASILGGFLILTGIGAAQTAGRESLLVALILTMAIFAYDGYFKRTPFGALMMGSCRFLNVMLGASAGAASFAELWSAPTVPIAGGLGVYIAGVTWFAREEGTGSERAPLIASALAVNSGLVLLIGYALWGDLSDEFRARLVAVALCVVTVTINIRLIRAIKNPRPATIQTAVKTMLMSYVTLCATLLLIDARIHVGYALATAMLLAPAVLLGRWIYVT